MIWFSTIKGATSFALIYACLSVAAVALWRHVEPCEVPQSLRQQLRQDKERPSAVAPKVPAPSLSLQGS
eukprot:4494651-Amphidinium_carterae.1